MNTIYLLLLSIFLYPFISLGQTQGQVYNYEIGDVLETRFMTNSLPPITYQLDTIVDKQVNGTIITYTIHRQTKYDGPPPYPQYNFTTETLTISTTATATHAPMMSTCLPYINSTNTGNCGQTVWKRESNSDTNCFEPPIWISSLYEGLGGPYYYGNDASNPGWFVQNELIYSNTAQWGECGNYYWIAGVEELSPMERELIKIVDLMGRETKAKPNTPLIYIYSDGSTEKMYIPE